MSNGYLTGCALIISAIITIIFLVRKNIGNFETKIFKKMLLCNVIESLITTMIVIIALTINSNKIFVILNRLDVIVITFWCSLMFFYLYNVAASKKKNINIVKYFITTLNIIIIFFAFILDVNIISTKEVLDSNGPLTQFGLYSSVFYIILMIMTLVITKIRKIKIKNNKYIPLYFLIFMLIIIAILRTIVPHINFISIMLTIVDLIMVFTIENPDLKMVNELLRNRELIEDQMEDKSDFLFEMSQGIKMPAKNILELTKTYDKLEEDIDKKDVITNIQANANELIFRTNNILDVSSMDASKIKIVDDDYNPYALFNEIKSFVNNKLIDKKIELNFKVNNNLPNRLCGDSIRLKQILMSVLINSIENTNSGYINVNIDSITRYDVARLIIKVEDSGFGMDINKVNKILDSSRNLSIEEIEKIDKLDVDMPAAIKIIKLLGGNINIRSNIGKGTIINIVIDQRYKLDEVTSIKKDIEKYSSDVYGRKRVLVVNDDKEELFKIKTILSKYNYDVNSTMIGKECIDKIKSGELYNLVIIDDDLRNNSALEILKEIKKDKKFNSNVIVTLEKEKEHFKNNYIEEGFNDYILKENMSEDLEKIISKYL